MLEREGCSRAPPASRARPAVPPPRAGARGRRHEERDTAQTHIVFGTDTFPLRDPRRLRAGAAHERVRRRDELSRLFQRVREELGLAYAVFAFQSLLPDSGQLGVYVGTQPGDGATRRWTPSARSMRALAARVCRPTELADGKQQVKGQVMLSLESPARPHVPAGRLRPVR